MSELTPLMKQYGGIKENHPDAILLFRLGDFYEMFGEDAKVASKILQIALTTRDKGKEEPMPMCGIPHFASETYIAKLIKAGHKVAVCEQVQDPKDAEGIVKRDVVRVITPGTHTPEHPKENNYILAFKPERGGHGIALADVSTGQFAVHESDRPIEDELAGVEPREVLYPASLKQDLRYADILSDYYATPVEDWRFDYPEALRRLLEHFRVTSLEGYGCEGMQGAVGSAGALIGYLQDVALEQFSFEKISLQSDLAYMFLDAPTQRNLELVRPLGDGPRESTLLWALDETLTPMGGRFLRNAILRPLVDVQEIGKRLQAVGQLVSDFELSESLRSGLRKVQDLERLERRISTGSANPRELIAIKSSLSIIPEIKGSLSGSKDVYLRELGDEMSEFPELISLIERGISDFPPALVRDGGVVRDGFSPEIDELRSISRDGKDYIASIQAGEREKTGISTLKVGFNKVFGYYIEVTKANLALVPETYIRKQTLVNAERFVTPELKEYESKVIGAEEKLKVLEIKVYQEILGQVRAESGSLLETAHAVARADFLLSLSVVAKRHDYVMPQVDGGSTINITAGRHPVLERLPSTIGKFIPNGVYLDGKTQRMLIITGPNMAGKSTYMRQVALIVLMAQVGSFVPAEEASIGIADRIFTRIGASDFLSRGQSTFMVEMIETANILNNATPQSLILLDEVGRGTSTFDGISIAWAAAEHIVKENQSRTLFATHYNELTELASALDPVRNFNVSVREWGEEIIFLRKIEEGPADKSYGIQVGRLAGLPGQVIARASEVLSGLESQHLDEAGMRNSNPGAKQARPQLDLFAGRQDLALKEVLSLDLQAMTPQEALEKLRELKRRLAIVS